MSPKTLKTLFVLLALAASVLSAPSAVCVGGSERTAAGGPGHAEARRTLSLRDALPLPAIPDSLRTPSARASWTRNCVPFPSMPTLYLLDRDENVILKEISSPGQAVKFSIFYLR